MPLPLPRLRPDRPRKRVEPASPVLREPPVRTYSFDPNAARQAWRQVARTRGAHGMRLDGRDGNGRLAAVVLGLVAVAAMILWWSGDDEAEPLPAAAVASADAPKGEVAGEPARFDPHATRDGLEPLPEAAVAPDYDAYDDADAPEVDPLDALEGPPRPTIHKHALPPDTPEENARALRKLPHASHDRPPVGGIGPEGLHVDRLTMGTTYEDGTCSGPVGKFSIANDGFANLCFRAVHRRVKQRVIVLWERDGELVRRTFVKIDDGHAYRTRAMLKLRRGYQGQWTVRVLAEDGIELGRQSFEVQR